METAPSEYPDEQPESGVTADERDRCRSDENSDLASAQCRSRRYRLEQQCAENRRDREQERELRRGGEAEPADQRRRYRQPAPREAGQDRHPLVRQAAAALGHGRADRASGARGVGGRLDRRETLVLESRMWEPDHENVVRLDDRLSLNVDDLVPGDPAFLGLRLDPVRL